MNIYNHANAEISGDDLCIVKHSVLGHYCGYCRFPLEAIPTSWHGTWDQPGMHFLAVHGGITYAEKDDTHATFGFDCNHSGDKENPKLRDPKHIFALTWQMRDQLIQLAAVYDEFLAADREKKIAMLEKIVNIAELPVGVGLGSMLEAICGAPSLGGETDHD